ncbi:MAG: Rieske 2Fe-2S domain-containing protein [Chloroflexi bacterium]|nr:Rieske 2Fe-2S domain-containing protein [Chloroflexota bacterium]
MSTTTEYVTVGHVDDVPPGQVRLVVVDGRAWAVANVDGSFFAVDNNCPHNGGPLAKGALEGRVLTCPWHGWRWDVASGANCWPGAGWRAPRVPVRVVDDCLQLPRL